MPKNWKGCGFDSSFPLPNVDVSLHLTTSCQMICFKSVCRTGLYKNSPFRIYLAKMILLTCSLKGRKSMTTLLWKHQFIKNVYFQYSKGKTHQDTSCIVNKPDILRLAIHANQERKHLKIFPYSLVFEAHQTISIFTPLAHHIKKQSLKFWLI